jgi:hypothetical protein
MTRFLVIIPLTLLLAGCEPTPTTPQSYSVIYRVDGRLASGTQRRLSSVTYTNAQGGHEQEQEPIIPWERIMGVSPGAFLYVSAQDSAYSAYEHGAYVPLTVVILVSGVEIKRSESRGPHVIATASMRCC